MSGNERAGNGRGNNRRRSFRRRDSDSQPGEVSRGGRSPAQENGASLKNDNSQKNDASRNQAGSRVSESQGHRSGGSRRGGDFRKERIPFIERPKWNPPKVSTEPLPVSDCPWCGKPIRDMPSAMADKDTGAPVHFDCVVERIAGGERLEKGDTLVYIGGGRFGIVNFDVFADRKTVGQEAPGQRSGGQEPRSSASAEAGSRPSPAAGRDFKIKRIIEWENKDKRADWRSVICEHYSVT